MAWALLPRRRGQRAMPGNQHPVSGKRLGRRHRAVGQGRAHRGRAQGSPAALVHMERAGSGDKPVAALLGGTLGVGPAGKACRALPVAAAAGYMRVRRYRPAMQLAGRRQGALGAVPAKLAASRPWGRQGIQLGALHPGRCHPARAPVNRRGQQVPQPVGVWRRA